MSSIYGTNMMAIGMGMNGFNPYQQISFPDYSTFWTNRAKTASSLGNPYSSQNYSDPGNYQMFQGYSNWNPNTSQYQGQYNDNGYSKNLANQWYTGNQQDWGDYQKNLQTPGEITAQNTYNTQMQNLNNSMGGKGMYGSSTMAKQANEGAYKTYSDTMATNAANAATNTAQMKEKANEYAAGLASNIYGQRTNEWDNLAQMAQQDNQAYNQFNQNRDKMQQSDYQKMNDYNLTRSQYQNAWNSNAADWDKWALGYDNDLQKASWNDYTLNSLKWDQSEQKRLMDNYTKVFDGINPLQEEKTQNEIATSANNRSSSGSFNWGNLASGVGSLLGASYGGGSGSLLGGLFGGTGNRLTDTLKYGWSSGPYG